ncbi:uncharacterized protein LOC100264564 isoform X6 [Vitis vinifera]|uniref:uncharacterized protein LOC100264564 isoform X6 n=1 Tax=Vitis vinifera TaxID=29760 RepID=UPI0028833D95|nr:uncharacterized protein LOC100264564 isoform X6 [Vitis vinifera]
MKFRKGSKVEVLNKKEVPSGAWHCAEIISGNGHNYSVRLLGSCHEFEVHKSNIRVRQAWIDDKWVVIGQGSITFEDVRVNKLLTSNCHQKMSFQVPQADMKLKLQAGDDFFQKHADFQDSPMVSSKTLKRASPYCSSGLEAYSGNIQKMRAIENGGRQRVITGYSSPLRAKGQSWRHACLASKGLKMMRGFQACCEPLMRLMSEKVKTKL